MLNLRTASTSRPQVDDLGIGRGSVKQLAEHAEAERLSTLAEARKEANDILTRAQKISQETRDADIAATKGELERMRERAADEIEAEKQRAIAELRGEVADLALAAAARVVGETMNDDRQRRLVREFIASADDADGKR